MKKIDYLILFVIGLVFFAFISILQAVPGYMDSEYYFGQALQLANGSGGNENFIWNYLNDPAAIPVNGFSYWLPVTSIIASIGLWITKSSSFFIAKIPFVLMAGSIPVMAAYLATHFLQTKRAGYLAGGLAMFMGLFLPYITITDTFTPFMFLGGLFFVVVTSLNNKKSKLFLVGGFILLGIIIGLLNLTRSDGLLWLAAGILVILLDKKKTEKPTIKGPLHLVSILFGFCAITIPWYARNWTLYYSIFPPGNQLMLWLTSYEDIFVYPSNILNIIRWSEIGLNKIILDRLYSFWSNLKTLVASGGSIIFFPFMLVGLIKKGKETTVRIEWVMLLLILVAMSFVFPYAGERGGFFHSLSALQVLLWALVPVGLDAAIHWGEQHRNWKNRRAWIMFSVTLLLAAVGLSFFALAEKINNGVENKIPWNDSLNTYMMIENEIKEIEPDPQQVIMVNDPPGYTLATSRPSVMIPSGGSQSILAVCERYDVKYVAINNERQEVKELFETINELAYTFDLIYEKNDLQVYEYKP